MHHAQKHSTEIFVLFITIDCRFLSCFYFILNGFAGCSLISLLCNASLLPYVTLSVLIIVFCVMMIILKYQFYFSVMYARNLSGKMLALYGGHSFYCGIQGAKRNIWRCTRWGGCKARFIMTTEGYMVTAHLEHNHCPPRYVIRDGTYFKI